MSFGCVRQRSWDECNKKECTGMFVYFRLIHDARDGWFIEVFEVFLGVNVARFLLELVRGTFVLGTHSMEAAHLAGAYSSVFGAVFALTARAVGDASA